MSVEVYSLQGGFKKAAVTLIATPSALFFTGLDNIALTPQTIVMSGGTAPYSFVGVGLPAGVTVGAASGIVSGTPTSPGITSASVTVTDSAAHTLSVPVFFDIEVGTFADSFARADQPFAVGDLWAITPLTQSTCIGTQISAAINVGGGLQLNLLICSSNGANEIMLYPVTVTWNQAFTNRAQYAQCKISADNSGGAIFAFNGPAVMINVNKSTGYFIQTNSPGNALLHYVITSLNGGGAQTTLDNNGGAGYTYANGDLLRIEAYPNTPVANQTTVKHYINGVLKNTVVDTTNHYSTGVYGIFDFFVSAGITQSWENFKGGILV